MKWINCVADVLSTSVKPAMVAMVAITISACGGGSSETGSTSTEAAPTIADDVTISGSVGDGPVVGAKVSIYDNAGTLIATRTSDGNANYNIRIKAQGGAYPLRIEATGGTDLVTGAVPEFTLVSTASHPSVKQVNLNPFTTLITNIAMRMPSGITPENLDAARSYVLDYMGFGFDTRIVPDPVTTQISDASIAMIVKSSEALGEAIRRTRSRLRSQETSLSADTVIARLSADLVDGELNGQGAGGADRRTTAMMEVVSAQVMVEALSNNLRVNGVVATGAMDDSILTTHPAGASLTASVRATAGLLNRTKTMVNAASAIAPSMALTTLSGNLDRIAPDSLPAVIEPILPGDTSQDLEPALLMTESADETELTLLLAAAVEPVVPAAPENRVPVIEGIPPPSVAEDSLYRFLPSASDGDGDGLSFSIVGRPAWLAFDSSTGGLSGTPSNADVGTYSGIVISVSDGVSSASIGPFSITVQNSNDAPVIGGTPPAVVQEGAFYNFRPTASDADGNPLSFSISGKPRWASFDAANGALSGTPAASDVGTTGNIVISVSDGALTQSLGPFSITVTALQASNSPPTLTGQPATVVAEDAAYRFAPVAADADGDPLIFSIANKPAWATFSAATGVLAGTPRNADVGTTSGIVITVSDGSAVASIGPFSVTVTNTNDAPTLNGTPSAQATVGVSYSFQPVAADIDGDPLIFSITNKPAWATFDNATGRLSGTPAAVDAGTTGNIVISASDGTVTTVLPAFSIIVDPVTGSARLSWTVPTSREDGSPLALNELAGYRIRYGTVPDALISRVEVNTADVTNYTISNLTAGTWYFSVSAYDTHGVESQPSNLGSLAIQ